MQTNIFKKSPADIFQLLGQPARLQILLVLGTGEACVCHIEAVLGFRQASISQHLMTLRKAGLVLSSRKGRHQFYSLDKPELYQAICKLALVTGASEKELEHFACKPVPDCPCPTCNPDMDLGLSCKKIKTSK